ncbi:Fic family protein [Fusobacterium periodonticum]|uniref:protein adenylyltransferase Fic n=1 Tax=Fusobacterium periodonticum TaxID=860 RepID=UPI0019571861|nr:Fic family protein [Fusobacterium periodonticum]VTX90647.1 Adenosine monophosphate-protein transferase NmFic [Fusobacterium periodonticum]
MNKYNFTETDKTILKRLVDEKEEEYLSKKRAKDLFEKDILSKVDLGTFKSLQAIHKYLFQDCFETAGLVRKHDIRKGDTLFCKAMYLEDNIRTVSNMKEDTFEDIIEKYVEMNMMHPFYEGNGRATRIWLDFLLIKRLGKCVDWKKIDKEDYLSAMRRSVINSLELKTLLRDKLTDDINNRDLYISNINQSYSYENMTNYDANNLDEETELKEKNSKK